MKHDTTTWLLVILVVIMIYVVYKIRHIDSKLYDIASVFDDTAYGSCPALDDLNNGMEHDDYEEEELEREELEGDDDHEEEELEGEELEGGDELEREELEGGDDHEGCESESHVIEEEKDNSDHDLTVLYDSKKISELKKIAEDLYIELPRRGRFTKRDIIEKIIKHKYDLKNVNNK